MTERIGSSVKRVLLINPKNRGSEGFQVPALTEPLGLEYVAGAVTDIVGDVRIHDDSSKPGDWKKEIEIRPPDIIGISCSYTVAVPEVRSLASEIRKVVGDDVLIVLGGHAISLRPSDGYTNDVDAIVIGNRGAEIFRNAVIVYGERHSIETVEGVHYRNTDGKFVSNVVEEGSPIKKTEFNSPFMDNRPLPRGDLADQFRDTYYLLHYPGIRTMETSRGCTHSCIFCSGHNFNKESYQSESPQRTIGQLESIRDGSYILMPDDFAFADIKGWNQIADHLIMTKSKRRLWAQTRADHIVNNRALFEKLAKAGLDMLLVGFESFDSVDLKKVGKGIQVDQNIQYNLKAIEILHEIGVRIWAGEILFQHFTRDHFLRLAEFNNQRQIDSPQYAIYTPLPATRLYEQELKLGNLTGNEDPREFDLFKSVLPTTLPKEEFYAWRDWLYLHTGYMPPGRIKQDIKEGFTTMADVRRLRDRIKQAYDTQRYRDLMERENQQKPTVIFNANDTKVGK